MRPYILAETNWKNLKAFKFELAILPWGATEAHNYHLPYATDCIEADHLAAEAARLAWAQKAKVIVLPTVPFGVNTGQSDIYLDINLNPSTQAAILCDIIETLNRQGIYKLMIFNSHGGNNWKSIIREAGLKYPSMFICVSNWFRWPLKEQFFDSPGDHADEVETSLLLYLRPDLVLGKKDWGKGEEKKFKIKEFSEGWVWAERKWSEISKDTGVGNPEKASAEKGAAFFKAITREMGDLFVKIAQSDLKDLYE